MESMMFKEITYHYYGGFQGGEYLIRIDANGYAYFEGSDESRGLFGKHECELFGNELERLFEYLVSSGFMSMNDEYRVDVCDGWSESLEVVLTDGTKKEVTNNIGCGPVELWAAMRIIDGLVFSRISISGDSSSQRYNQKVE